MPVDDHRIAFAAEGVRVLRRAPAHGKQHGHGAARALRLREVRLPQPGIFISVFGEARHHAALFGHDGGGGAGAGIGQDIGCIRALSGFCHSKHFASTSKCIFISSPAQKLFRADMIFRFERPVKLA